MYCLEDGSVLVNNDPAADTLSLPGTSDEEGGWFSRHVVVPKGDIYEFPTGGGYLSIDVVEVGLRPTPEGSLIEDAFQPVATLDLMLIEERLFPTIGSRITSIGPSLYLFPARVPGEREEPFSIFHFTSDEDSVHFYRIFVDDISLNKKHVEFNVLAMAFYGSPPK